MTNNKKVGDAIERRARDKLKAMGALDVQRAPSSMGMFDLWALFPDHLKLLSIKESKFMRSFKPEANKIRSVTVPRFCVKALWVWYSYRPKRINKRKPNFKGWVITEAGLQ